MAFVSFALAGAAFTPISQLPASHGVARGSVPQCSLLEEVSPRRAVLSAAVGIALGLGANPASAGYVTSLGLETTKPKDAEKDDELLASKEVQKSIDGIKGYKVAAASLKSAFAGDSAMPLIPAIRKEFDFSKVRDDLNTAATVFDDQTQLTTDRIARSILYDLTELEGASRLKKGETERTEKKIANVEKWFKKLDVDIDTFLAYFA
uniref:Uncharacterized protein n=1 Tax=Prymnesium polylepis TaxID=72548 RepID=A0A6T8BZZ0_9EUKA